MEITKSDGEKSKKGGQTGSGVRFKEGEVEIVRVTSGGQNGGSKMTG